MPKNQAAGEGAPLTSLLSLRLLPLWLSQQACLLYSECSPDSFSLLVGVRDSWNLTASTTLRVTIVNINDEIPRFTR